MAFPTSLPCTVDGLEQLLKKLDGWRIASSGVTMQGTDLQLGARYTELRDPYPEDTNTKWAETVPFPLEFRLPRFPALDEQRDRLRLTRPVCTPQGSGYSQVYGARFLPEVTGDVDVVVKIYQASRSAGFRNVADVALKDPPPLDDWEEELLSFRNEAWAYSKLAHLQGSIVPYVHGFFEVTLPHGEPAIALVMEEVRGTNEIPLNRSYQDSSAALDEVADRLLSAGQTIVAAGIMQADVLKRHIFWPSLSTSDRLGYPIFIDFESLITPDSESAWAQLSKLGRILPQYGFSSNLIIRWIKANVIPDSKIAKWFMLPAWDIDQAAVFMMRKALTSPEDNS